MRPQITTVVTDLDNTLHDWLEMWGATFRAMLGVLVERSGVPQPIIEADARAVHQRNGTTEYAFLLQALPCLKRRHPGEELREVYCDAIRAFREARERSLRLFPTVLEALAALKSRGCLVVGYTDSRAFHAGYRARKLGLDGLLDYLYSQPDHAVPAGTDVETVRTQPREAYEFQKTVHRLLPEGEVKPNAAILRDIIEDVGATPRETVYVGDSLTKDVAMAKEAGVIDVFARYGVTQHREDYELLRRVSHWTDAEIERERRMRALCDIHPTYALGEAFAELLDLFEFGPFAPKPAARGSGSTPDGGPVALPPRAR